MFQSAVTAITRGHLSFTILGVITNDKEAHELCNQMYSDPILLGYSDIICSYTILLLQSQHPSDTEIEYNMLRNTIINLQLFGNYVEHTIWIIIAIVRVHNMISQVVMNEPIANDQFEE